MMSDDNKRSATVNGNIDASNSNNARTNPTFIPVSKAASTELNIPQQRHQSNDKRHDSESISDKMSFGKRTDSAD